MGVCCPFPHASAFCAGTCRVGVCDPGWGDCNTFDGDGCETSLRTTYSCGFCYAQCAPVQNGMPACPNGTCTIGSCTPPFADCNVFSGDGCEANTDTDPSPLRDVWKRL